MTCFHENEAKKYFFFEKKNSKWPTKKKAHFPALPILNIFLRQFHGLVLWFVELIDAKGISVAQPSIIAKILEIIYYQFGFGVSSFGSKLARFYKVLDDFIAKVPSSLARYFLLCWVKIRG